MCVACFRLGVDGKLTGPGAVTAPAATAGRAHPAGDPAAVGGGRANAVDLTALTADYPDTIEDAL